MMDIKQGERYLVVGNGYGQPVELHEVEVVEMHDKFAKTLNVITGGVQWRYVTDLQGEVMARLPPLPGR